MTPNKDKPLTNEQLATVIKLSLDFNALIISQASLIYNQPLKPRSLDRYSKWLIKAQKEYNANFLKIIS